MDIERSPNPLYEASGTSKIMYIFQKRLSASMRYRCETDDNYYETYVLIAIKSSTRPSPVNCKRKVEFSNILFWQLKHEEENDKL